MSEAYPKVAVRISQNENVVKRKPASAVFKQLTNHRFVNHRKGKYMVTRGLPSLLPDQVQVSGIIQASCIDLSLDDFFSGFLIRVIAIYKAKERPTDRPSTQGTQRGDRLVETSSLSRVSRRIRKAVTGIDFQIFPNLLRII